MKFSPELQSFAIKSSDFFILTSCFANDSRLNKHEIKIQCTQITSNLNGHVVKKRKVDQTIPANWKNMPLSVENNIPVYKTIIKSKVISSNIPIQNTRIGPNILPLTFS